MKQFRAIYTSRNSRESHYDFFADDKDQAMDVAISSSRSKGFDNVMVCEIPQEPYVVGFEVEILVDESRCKKGFIICQPKAYFGIKAKNELDAIDYYRRHLQYNWCDTNLNLDEEGYWKFGKILDTYIMGNCGAQYFTEAV